MKKTIKSMTFLAILSLWSMLQSGCGIIGIKPQTSLTPLAEKRLSQLVEPNNKQDNYVLILSAPNSDNFHRRNMARLYKTFTQDLSDFVKEENVFVLFSSPGEKPGYPVDGKTTAANLDAVFNYLEKVVDEKDYLLLFVAGHGDKTFDSSSLAGSDIFSFHLKENLQKIKPAFGLGVFGPCYANEFARRTALAGNYVGISMAPYYDISIQSNYWNLLRKVFVTPTIADNDADGKTSVLELFKYLRANDKSNKKMRIESHFVDPDKVYIR